MPRIMLSFSISDFATVTCRCFLVLQKCSSVAVLGIHFEVKLFNDGLEFALGVLAYCISKQQWNSVFASYELAR